MDSSILQLFSLEEILERIAANAFTGLLHVYNQRDASNIFFKSGLVVAAAKGLIEGEDAVRQTLDLKDPRCTWQAGAAPQMPPYKPISVNIQELFDLHAIRKASPEKKIAVLPVAPPPPTSEIPQPAPPPFLSVPRHAGLTTTLPRLEAPMTVQTSRPSAAIPQATGAPGKALTTTFSPDAGSKKPQYAFVAIDNPRQKLRLTKESTLVGRNPACDITLDHGSISRQHCLVQLTDRGLHLKDLGTTNGTKINGISMTEGYVNAGDQVTMGHLVFLLEKD